MTDLLVSEEPVRTTSACECVWPDDLGAARGTKTPSAVRIGVSWRGRMAQMSLDGLQGFDGRLHPAGVALLPEGIRRLLYSETIESWRRALPAPLREVELVLLPEASQGMARIGVEWPLQLRFSEVPQWSCGALQLLDASPANQLAWAKLFVSAGWPIPPISASVDGAILVGGVELLPTEIEQLEPGDWVSLRDTSQCRDGVRADFVPTEPAWSTRPVLLRRHQLKLDETRLLKPAASSVVDSSTAGHASGLVHAKVLSDSIALPLVWICNPHQPFHLPASRQRMRWWLVHEGIRRAELKWQAIGRQPGFRIAAVSR
jgi:hypothetical protein